MVTRILSLLTLALSASVSSASAQQAAPVSRLQAGDADPFRGNYLLGASSEIVVLRADPADGTVYLDLFDANGTVEQGLSLKGRRTESGEWGLSDFQFAALDAVAADLDGDRQDEVVAAWESPDFTVTLYTASADAATLEWDDPARQTVQDAGLLPASPYTEFSHIERPLRLAAGHFDEDEASEVVLAYFADDAETESGPIQLVLYDAGTGAALEPVASIADKRLSPYLPNRSLQEGSHLDVAAGDFDGDGTDEIALAFVEAVPEAEPGDFGWQLVVSVYDLDAGGALVPQGRTSIHAHPHHDSEAVARLSIATGDANNDLRDEIVAGYQIRSTDTAVMRNYLQVITASGDLQELQTARESPEQVEQSSGDVGYPLSVTMGDADRDGRDDILYVGRQGFRAYSLDDAFSLRQIGNASTGFEDEDRHHRTVALTDVDAPFNDSLRTEVVLLDTAGVRIYSNLGAADGLELPDDPTASAPLPGEPFVPDHLVLVTGDFDGDAVMLGPPARATRTDIVQPLVALNAPPIHFDVIGGTVFDVNECFNLPAGGFCEHEAFYHNAQEVTQEVQTEVFSDWGVSKSLSAEAGVELFVVGLAVRTSLDRTYGEGFGRVQGNETTFTVTSTSGATYDDRVYATVIDYEVLEYPVYADGEVAGHVLAVIPQLEEAQNTWFAGKSARARAYQMPHEVGNLLSYPATPVLPEGARLFGSGQVSGGGDAWEMSAQAAQDWELAFSSSSIDERERSAYQQVSRSSGGGAWVGLPFFGASLESSVSASYGAEQIATHRTTVRKESALQVHFGTIDGGILGTKTYTVTPFVYWAASGALVLDYAVQLDQSAGVASWWTQQYGDAPDLAFTLPWRYDPEKGLGSTNADVQREETRDLFFDPADPRPGETATLFARVHNYSLRDMEGTASLRFYLGDPDAGGTPITGAGGQSDVDVPQLPPRASALVQLAGWQVPSGVARDAKVYAVLDPDGTVDEVHENNNVGWTLLDRNAGSGVAAEPGELPAGALLGQNYPNPFKRSTTIAYRLRAARQVTLTVHDLLGREVATLVDGLRPPGAHRVRFDGSGLPSGLYFYRLTTGAGVHVRRMLLVR